MSRERSNWIVMLVRPRALDEVMESIPGMLLKAFSSGVATEDAIVSGLAPGQAGGDGDGRKIDVGEIAHRQPEIGEQAEGEQRQHDQGGRDRTADAEFRNAHGRAEVTAGGGGGGQRRGVFRRPPGPRHGAVLPLDHNFIPLLQAFEDEGGALEDAVDLQLAYFGGAVRILSRKRRDPPGRSGHSGPGP